MVETQQDFPCEKQSSLVKMELSEGKSDTAFHQHEETLLKAGVIWKRSSGFHA